MQRSLAVCTAMLGLLSTGCFGSDQQGQGAALVDPNATYVVQVASAEIQERNSNGNRWDPDGSPPDVRVTFECPPDQGRTSTSVVESFTPEWNTGVCTARAGVLMEEGFSFWLEDDDAVVADAITPSIVVVPKDFEIADGTLIIRGSQAMKSITLRFLKTE